ncbi:PREDICTED: activator of basal transcription 1 [Fragaria vesca subsp. vesca]|uniref:activator of basal transcription 1 n=1 Tax=Fragaria vesca subsp. vesca TaxID=101020 RepID=UPI0002C36766|nr:PREDICTED: activator of basal transcription 1 [Fragaria vesca subsp. vesca]XP_011468323.1 PREDICTED: activator of basal transcription 1 [Fragaria vesca subsp. vesca]XP_011468324.1 PREDICTED: activator of basal transcription 1 [Fragaria vesca subsp. vesca]XP_011468325.1 PREDICTED: activator of basal transcription 1 [Fragaria vesca subsp. vesca]
MDVTNPKKKKKPLSPGVCYLGRIPPRMDHKVVRHLLSPYGELDKIYLVPRNPSAPAKNRDRPGKYQTESFSEGWVEFKDKRVAKRVASMLNGEKIGGKKRSAFYYDLWNIKYLSKFKWDDLTGEIAYKNAEREQKLAMEISAAKKEQEFYLSKVESSRKLSAIEERMKKKRKVQEESGTAPDVPVEQPLKLVRQFRQKSPVADGAAKKKPSISRDLLAGVFGSS